MTAPSAGPGGAAWWILGIVLTLHLSLKIYKRFTPNGSRLAPQERKLVKEIKELNRQAHELSTPDTFAKSAKLKRQAAAKEKELAKIRDRLAVQKGWWRFLSPLFPYILPTVLRVALYVLLTFSFWRTPVATIPVALVKPADYFLKIGKRDASGEFIAVGIIPWLVVSSTVSEFISDKMVGRAAAKKPSAKRV